MCIKLLAGSTVELVAVICRDVKMSSPLYHSAKYLLDVLGDNWTPGSLILLVINVSGPVSAVSTNFTVLAYIELP